MSAETARDASVHKVLRSLGVRRAGDLRGHFDIIHNDVAPSASAPGVLGASKGRSACVQLHADLCPRQQRRAFVDHAQPGVGVHASIRLPMKLGVGTTINSVQRSADSHARTVHPTLTSATPNGILDQQAGLAQPTSVGRRLGFFLSGRGRTSG